MLSLWLPGAQAKAEHDRELAAVKEASNSLQTRLDRATGARSEGIGGRGSALLEQILASSPAQVAGDLIRQGKVREEEFAPARALVRSAEGDGRNRVLTSPLPRGQSRATR